MTAVPEIRFPDFDGEWPARKLSYYLSVKGMRNRGGRFHKNDVLSVSGDHGIVNQIRLLGRSYAGVSVADYHVVETGDVVYTKSPLKTNPFGIIKANKGVSGIVSTLYAVYETSAAALPEFIDFYFELDEHTNRYLRPLVHKGAKNDMKISNERVLIDPVRFPVIAEQQKIAAFLGAVDHKIDALRRKHETLKQFKAGLMQKLFGQELRFKRDDGSDHPDWEEKTFSALASKVSEGFDPRTADGQPIVIELENLESDTGRIAGYSSIAGQTSNKSRFHSGDVLFGKLRPYLRKFARPDFDGVCSTEIWVLRGKKISNDFLFHLVQSSRFSAVATISSGSKMPRSDWSIVSSAEFMVPAANEEQQKIADCLSAVDAKVEAVEGQITHMEQFKKGLLQKMFV